MKKSVLFVAFQFVVLSVSGQSLTGIVVEADNKKPISGVKVGIENSGIWTVTDNSGVFQINYNANETLVFSRSGLIEERKSYVETPNNKVTIEMQVASIRIKEIMLSAKKKNYSEIEIKEEALQKIQSFSLGDVLQQLPGQYVEPLNNTEMKNIVMRTAATQGITGSSVDSQDFGNKAFGTQLMINDVVVSNNSNMQDYNAAYGNPFSTNTIGSASVPSFGFSHSSGNITPSQPNYGVDLRQIPTDDIEKITVIAGIPDAKYGDLTSGLIKVETKTGKKPLQLMTSLVEGTYQIGASKGFEINKKGDAINASFNYMNSAADARLSSVIYERFTSNIMWSTSSKQRNFRNKLGLSFSKDKNEGQQGENEYDGIYIKAENTGFGITNNTTFKFSNPKIIRNVNANIGINYSEQNSVRRNFLNLGAKPYGTSYENSVYYGSYTDPQYFNYNYVDGNPFNLFADISAENSLKTKSNWIHNYSVGINFQYNDNFGKGRYGTVGQFSTASANNVAPGTREYNYADEVLSIKQFSGYIQDNIFKKFDNNSVLTTNIGLRYDNQNKYSVLSPRLNASYKFRNITLRAGSGISSKAPSLNMVYTGPRYLDLLLGDYRLPGVYSVAIMQTIVTPANNADLKPSKSWRSEIGLDFNLPFMTAGITGYRNKLYDGFTTGYNILELQKAKVDIQQNGNLPPTFTLNGTEVYRYIQNLQTNDYESTDTGVELLIGFKKIESLNLTVGLKGSYVKTISGKTLETIEATRVEDTAVSYGIFSPYKTTAEMMRAGLSLDYHIPQAGLIVSINTDHFFIDSRTSKNDLVGYLDQNLIRHSMTTDMSSNAGIKSLVNSGGASDFNLNDKTLHNFHLRVTKNFLNGFRVSVYLNNMFNLKAYNNYGAKYAYFTPISFGGNLSYQF